MSGGICHELQRTKGRAMTIDVTIDVAGSSSDSVLDDELVFGLADILREGGDGERFLEMCDLGLSQPLARELATSRQFISKVMVASALEAGMSAEDLCEALGAGVTPRYYTDGRRSGAVHQETLAAWRQGSRGRWYALARTVGATHGEYLEMLRWPAVSEQLYAHTRRAGASHGEICEALRLGGSLRTYAQGRLCRITHHELCDVMRLDCDLASYVAQRDQAIVDLGEHLGNSEGCFAL
jgi:hypothetical protein